MMRPQMLRQNIVGQVSVGQMFFDQNSWSQKKKCPTSIFPSDLAAPLSLL
jgi:hypothetical protein